MRLHFLRITVLVTASLLTLPAVAAKHSHKNLKKAGKATAAASSHPRAMDDARATEIQTALVKAGYLPSVSGHWDEASADAMRKLQSDNGWQTKLIPDSRALIKLGLGPGSPAASTAGGSSTASASASGSGSSAAPEQK